MVQEEAGKDISCFPEEKTEKFRTKKFLVVFLLLVFILISFPLVVFWVNARRLIGLTRSFDKGAASVLTKTQVTTIPKLPQKYAVIVSGISETSIHYDLYKKATRRTLDLLLRKGYLRENIYYLFENPEESEIELSSTGEGFLIAVEDLKRRATGKDQILFLFIGHGISEEGHSFYSLSDFDLSDEGFAELIENLKREKLILVFNSCHIGGFLKYLSGPETIVIAATRFDEKSQSVVKDLLEKAIATMGGQIKLPDPDSLFEGGFIEALLTGFEGEGDQNNDGQVSFSEAFNFASVVVAKQYELQGEELTEHAQLDDNGDGVGHEAPIPNGGDGELAAKTFL